MLIRSLGVAALVAAVFILVTAVLSDLGTGDVVFGLVFGAAAGIGNHLRRRRRRAANT